MQNKSPQSILITGCSTGIGLGVALDLHKLGYQVFATARKLDDINKLKKLGLNSLQLDVTDSNSINLALENILNQTGGTLDILFNNAGYGQVGAVEDLTKSAIMAQFDTNVFGLLELTNKVLPIMREQGRGKIIVTSSILGFISLKYRGAYVASKFALEGLMDALRLELYDTPISVSIIQPGPIRSNFRNTSHDIFNKYINPQASPHFQQYQNMQAYYNKQTASNIFEMTHHAITKKVVRIIKARRPYARYSVTFPTYLFRLLVRILPRFILDKILLKITQTESKTSSK